MADGGGDGWHTVPTRKKKKKPDNEETGPVLGRAQPKARPGSSGLSKRDRMIESQRSSDRTATPQKHPRSGAERKKPRQRAKGPKGPLVSNKKEAQQLIKNITQAFDGSVTYTDLSNQIKIQTGHSWNKKFKPKYGGLLEFVQSIKSLTLVTDDNGIRTLWVTTAYQEHQVLAAQQREKKRAKRDRQKKQRGGNTNVNVQNTTTTKKSKRKSKPRTTTQPVKESSGICGFLMSMLLLITLVIAIVVAQQGGWKSQGVQTFVQQIVDVLPGQMKSAVGPYVLSS